MNESEPLMRSRKVQPTSKPGVGFPPGSSTGLDLKATGVASGLEAARARIGLEPGTFEPVAPMPRDSLKQRPCESQSLDAGHRGGSACSSVESPVTGVEPRGRVARLRPEANASAEEPMGKDQPLRRESWRVGDGSRMSREAHVRF